ncbi:hypothetical protein MMC10_000237 [Thelotrema lepadinum]|nr:hypothetical protein [Thelotrema lepadinum]
MDHIPTPRKPKYPPLEVPYLGSIKYDNGPFLECLERTQWTQAEIFEGSSKRSAFEIDAILEAWLFFGFMHEVFRVDIKCEDFLRVNETGQHVLSTAALPSYARRWENTDGNLPKAERQRLEQRLTACFRKIAGLLDRIGQFESKCSSELLLVCAVLHNYVGERAHHVYGPFDREAEELPGMDGAIGHPRVMRFIEERLSGDGWCPSEITRLFHDLAPAEVYYVSLLDRPDKEVNHQGCTKLQCQAYQVTANYKRRHVTPGCDCADLFASQSELYDHLKLDGVVPVISSSLGTDLDGKACIELLSSSETEYVAISHVWSQGLGNNVHNAMTACQYRELNELVAGLHGERSAWWLDTVCFPLEPPEAYDLALIKMRDTYEKATKVLVVDRTLMEYRWCDMTEDEALYLILSCPWNRRLWTLQEATLATILYFQFADRVVDLSDLLEFQGRELVNSIRAADPGLLEDVENLTRDPRGIYRKAFMPKVWNPAGWLQLFPLRPLELRGSKVISIRQAREALSFRSTSVSEDEALCLGNLLGLRPEPIVAAQPGNRMKAFWDSLPSVAANVLFYTGPKLQDPGYRWAPASLLGRYVSEPEFHNLHFALRSELGLQAQLPGVHILTPIRSFTNGFLFVDCTADDSRDEKLYSVGVHPDPEEIHGDRITGVLKESQREIVNPKSMSLILPEPLDLSRSSDTVAAALVEVNDLKIDCITCRFICGVLIREVEDEAMEVITNQVQARNMDVPRELLLSLFSAAFKLKGERTPKDQNWLVQ